MSEGFFDKIGKKQPADASEHLTFRDGLMDAMAFLVSYNMPRHEAVNCCKTNVRRDVAMENAYADYPLQQNA